MYIYDNEIYLFKYIFSVGNGLRERTLDTSIVTGLLTSEADAIYNTTVINTLVALNNHESGSPPPLHLGARGVVLTTIVGPSSPYVVSPTGLSLYVYRLELGERPIINVRGTIRSETPLVDLMVYDVNSSKAKGALDAGMHPRDVAQLFGQDGFSAELVSYPIEEIQERLLRGDQAPVQLRNFYYDPRTGWVV